MNDISGEHYELKWTLSFLRLYIRFLNFCGILRNNKSHSSSKKISTNVYCTSYHAGKGRGSASDLIWFLSQLVLEWDAHPYKNVSMGYKIPPGVWEKVVEARTLCRKSPDRSWQGNVILLSLLFRQDKAYWVTFILHCIIWMANKELSHQNLPVSSSLPDMFLIPGIEFLS